MPIIRVEMFEGHTVEQKRELVRVFTREMARICGGNPAAIPVVIADIQKHNWGLGGELGSDQYPEKP